MQGAARGWARTARALLFASTAVALAVVAHVLGDAMAPSWLVTAVAVVIVFVGAHAGAAKEQSFAALAAALLAVQVALHVAFMTTVSGAGSLLTVPLGRLCTSGSRSQTMRVAMTAPSGGARPVVGSLHLAVSSSSMSFTMLAGHLLAALTLAWCLRWGEAAVWSLARLPGRVALQVLRVLGALLGPLGSPFAPSAAPRRCEQQVQSPRSRVLRHVLVLRGPPLPA